MNAARAVRDILLATDFSEASEPAVRVARDYAYRFGARVHLVHVAAPSDPGAAARLGGIAATFAPAEVVARVLGGPAPAAAIVGYAREHGIDLIVLGTHGRTGVSHLLLGSIAERVVRTAPCPVLTVPAAADVPAVEIQEPDAEPRPCLVCGVASDDLICSSCRARIRGEMIDRKQREERAGRR
jgi:nucleotide-binding universal stress UspA family protein